MFLESWLRIEACIRTGISHNAKKKKKVTNKQPDMKLAGQNHP